MNAKDYDDRARATVACPYCNAKLGEKCIGSSGKQIVNTHHARRAAAAIYLKKGT